MTPEERAKRIIWKLETDQPSYPDGEEFIASQIIEAQAEAVQKTVERAIKIISDLKVDKPRCRELLLTEQAWEEAQWQCESALRDLMPEKVLGVKE